MKIKPNDIESIEACRPHSDDRESSDFQSIAERIEQNQTLASFSDSVQRLDRKIADEIKIVPVPSEFKERLLSALARSAAVKPQASFLGVSRRNWIGLAIGMSASAACLALALFFVTPEFAQRTESELIQQAFERHAKISGNSWIHFRSANQNQRKLLPPRFARPTKFLQDATTSTIFFSFNQPSAFLMVTPGRSDKIGATSPPSPRAGTGANSQFYCGVWQSKGHIYVLAVKGNKLDYEQMNASIHRLAVRGTRNSLPHRHNRNT